ncbi:hypothetical protein ID875_03075 [Streptomyces globisporus]|uniref:Uncharacterized protein n=1 Tax=Streptomyces globisporus TaxID=1908 RepID=A0A927BIY7_STRGL|nr:hypothetical protein [Streptomyces globisporus]
MTGQLWLRRGGLAAGRVGSARRPVVVQMEDQLALRQQCQDGAAQFQPSRIQG